ncbi:MAG: helix-turn-helix transcriptional regulator [Candidatus ainarchaeum sp.]|nr:helix-turn-helix transcriptional regulator [Candidatus ainarchaeum sp.]
MATLEAIWFLCRRSGRAENRLIRDYFEGGCGAVLDFSVPFAPFSKRKKVHQKTVYRNVLRLESAGLVRVERKMLGKRRLDHYRITPAGSEKLKLERVKRRVSRVLPAFFDVLQAPAGGNLWAALE